MKRLPLILTVAFLVLPVGGYFLYNYFFDKSSAEPWGLVPESSVLVYEPGNCSECVASTAESSVWKIVQKASFYGKSSELVNNVFQFLKDSPADLISLHVTKKDDFDFVFYKRIDEKKVAGLFEEWKTNKQLKFTEREFNEAKIREVSFANNVFSWVVLDNMWVGTFTPFLIEDVIRTHEAGSVRTFKNTVSDVYQLPKMKNDAGNVYVHLKNFTEWLNVFVDSKSTSQIQHLAKSCILDIKSTENTFVANGFSSDSLNSAEYILSIFADQTPVPFNLRRLISNRSVMVTSYGISNGDVFKKNLINSKIRKASLKDTLTQLSKSLNLNLDKFYKNINGEIGLCFVEKGKNLSNVLLIETTQPAEWINSFNAIAAKLSVDTIFFEKFSDYEIRELPLYRFPEKVFGPLVSGFDKSYYTSAGKTIMIADDLEELKSFLEDIDHEETWGKSVSQNKFLESTLLEANLSVYINTSRIWNILSGSTNSKWSQFISDNSKLLNSLDMGAIQFSHLNESFYTNIAWTYQPVEEEKEVEKKSSGKRVITNFANSIARMFVIKNHTDKRDEILIQDSLNNLHLISADGKVLWKVEIESLIQGSVEQIDFLNNGKLQYLFIAGSKLYLIDRLGKNVDPYPIDISASDIEYLSVVDYDHSKKYRFLLASKTGALWMFDKEGKNLEGWNPKTIGDGLVTAARHHRIRGKDYVIAIRKDGNVYLMNRRGETLKNFPLNLNGRPSGDYFIETGNSAATSYFVVVTRDGYRVKFNLEGKVQSRETLLKTSVEAQFSLVPEQKEKSYLIKRQESKQLVLTDAEGKELIRNDFIGMNAVDIEYKDHGAGVILITVTDVIQNLSFVYDGQGNLLTTPPLESHFINVKPNNSSKPKIFSAFQKALNIQTLP